MINKTGTIFLAAVLLATPAAAVTNEEYAADLKTCEERAKMRDTANRHTSTTSTAIGGAANILGAVIAGRDPTYAISGLAQGGVHAAANDAQMAAYRRQAAVDQCLREMTAARMKR